MSAIFHTSLNFSAVRGKEPPIKAAGPVNVRVKINRRNRENDDVHYNLGMHVVLKSIPLFYETHRLYILQILFELLIVFCEYVVFYLGQS